MEFKPLKEESRIFLDPSINIDLTADEISLDVRKTEKRKFSELRLFHFMKYHWFKKNFIDSGNQPYFVFTSPKIWIDAYERKMFDAAPKWCDDLQNMFCLCTSYSASEALEALYHRGSILDTTVRLSIKVETFLKELDTFALKNDADIYITLIDYSFDQDDIRKKIALLNKNDFAPSIHDSINFMSLKRKAFSYEHEVRIFIVTKSSAFNASSTIKLPISNFLNVVGNIQLPPHDPSKEELDDILATHDRWVTQDNATAIAQNEIKTAFPKLKVTRSRLYEF